MAKTFGEKLLMFLKFCYYKIKQHPGMIFLLNYKPLCIYAKTMAVDSLFLIVVALLNLKSNFGLFLILKEITQPQYKY